MAITWAEVRGKVRGDLWRPGPAGLPDDVCDRAIHASLLELEAPRRWLWLEAIRRPVVLTAAADQISMPDDLVSLSSVAIVRLDGRMDRPLSAVSLGRVRILASQSQVGGDPTVYALGNRIVYLDEQAPAGTTVEFVGKARTPDDIADAIAGANTNPTLQLHQAIVIAGACAQAARIYLKNEAEEARQQRAFDRGLDRLQEREDEQRGDAYGGLAVPDTSYQDMAGG